MSEYSIHNRNTCQKAKTAIVNDVRRAMTNKTFHNLNLKQRENRVDAIIILKIRTTGSQNSPQLTVSLISKVDKSR